MSSSFQVTLEQAVEGDPTSTEQVWTAVYQELRKIAHGRMRRERSPQTLQTTALVHEAYLRLAGNADILGRGRRYLIAAAARAMYQVLIDRARERKAQKRGGSGVMISLTGTVAAIDADPVRELALTEAMEKLERKHGNRIQQVVILRHIAGLDNGEIAELLRVSTKTVERDWKFARAWLRRELTSPAEGRGGS